MLADFRVLELDYVGVSADTRGMETNARHEVLARLAAVCGFNFRQAIYVPATVGVFAKSAGWSECRMADELFRNVPLREYFVELIHKADSEGPVAGWGPEAQVAGSHEVRS